MKSGFQIIFISMFLIACETLPPLGVPLIYVRVYNDEGAPVPLAHVNLLGSAASSITDGYGRASIVLIDYKSARNIEVSHPQYFTEKLVVEDEFAFVTLQNKGSILQESYELAKRGFAEEALSVLNEREGFEASSYREKFFIATLHYLVGNYAESVSIFYSTSETNKYQRRIIRIISEILRYKGRRR